MGNLQTVMDELQYYPPKCINCRGMHSHCLYLILYHKY